ncbi:MAG: methyltransferase domain-containing protein [FCB group bacterium]|nr:methyltransferase domain-containing protein [FCB group bacterium]MBL7027707.1 methyltransferase domain-containing protein [Candidatus Neomarinimicrobiota bacterium]MBL7121046.1 methyltransferase domain-containing protein [Candidatus Neomarinimicrobiota bacterium]
MSGWYDLLAGLSEKKYKDMGLQILDIQAGEQVLEVGFGTGQCLKEMARAVGETGRVFGVDLSQGMLDVAQSRLHKAGLGDLVEFCLGDATELPYADNSFDAVYSSFTLELFDTPEIPVVLSECQRVLKPGGRLCMVSMSKKSRSGLMVKLYEWTQKNFNKYVDCRPIYVEQSIGDNGFIISSVTEMSMFGLPVDIVLATKAW